MTKLQKFLLFCILFVIFLLLIFTAIAITSGTAKPANNLRKEDPEPELLVEKSLREGTKTNIYSALGTLRCTTADNPTISVVIKPYFPYPDEDRAFFEELSSKNKKLQQIIVQYIKQNTIAQLKEKSEKTVKNEILEQFNNALIMGKIDVIYFDEYIFLE